MKKLGWAYLLLLSACDPNSEEAFLSGRSLNPCAESKFACPGQFAECLLDETKYARVAFPGIFPFLVDAPSGATIEVQIFLSEQRDAGIETSITWFEPGCTFDYVSRFDGDNLFEEAGETSLILREQRIQDDGEHLVEIDSDMQALTFVSVDVILPNEERDE